MKLVFAIVKPFKVIEIVDAVLHETEFPGLTVSDGRGFGREKTGTDQHTRGEELRDFTDHSLIMSAVPDDLVEHVVETLRSIAHTGLSGDGKIFVLDLEDAIRVRTGERGEAALR